MLKFLTPKEEGFFAQFDALAACEVEVAETFLEMLEHYGDAPAKERRIREIEHRADEISHRSIEMLHKTFITPFDRNDIHRLISRMDDILDLVQDSAETMTLYDVRAVTPEAVHLGNLIRICCERVHQAVGLLSSMKNADAILKLCHELDQLESDADKVLRARVQRWRSQAVGSPALRGNEKSRCSVDAAFLPRQASNRMVSPFMARCRPPASGGIPTCTMRSR